MDYRFDNRVALQYDALRGHPADISGVVGRQLHALIGGKPMVLEPGVGTGRIALPLVEAGCRVVGMDVSSEMLNALAGRAPDGLHLVRGDIAHLPFAADSFDAALCVHVLHLVDSRAVLGQLMNIVRPGGRIVLARDWVDPASCTGQMRQAFRQSVVDLADSVNFPTGARGFVEQLTALGAIAVENGAERTIAEWQTDLSPKQVLDGIASRDDAESWVLPDPLLSQVIERLDEFVRERWKDPGAMQTVRRRFVASIFEVP